MLQLNMLAELVGSCDFAFTCHYDSVKFLDKMFDGNQNAKIKHLLTDRAVNAAKYSDPSTDVRAERSGHVIMCNLFNGTNFKQEYSSTRLRSYVSNRSTFQYQPRWINYMLTEACYIIGF